MNGIAATDQTRLVVDPAGQGNSLAACPPLRENSVCLPSGSVMDKRTVRMEVMKILSCVSIGFASQTDSLVQTTNVSSGVQFVTLYPTAQMALMSPQMHVCSPAPVLTLRRGSGVGT